jgi:mono/diheme cytochrome c family protein
MSMRAWLGFTVALAGLTAAACGDDSGGASSGSTCPDGSALTYESFGQDFFMDHCSACHGSNGPERPKLDSLAQIRAHRAQIDQQAAAGPNGVNTRMPESGSVSEDERRKLGAWLACGAP